MSKRVIIGLAAALVALLLSPSTRPVWASSQAYQLSLVKASERSGLPVGQLGPRETNLGTVSFLATFVFEGSGSGSPSDKDKKRKHNPLPEEASLILLAIGAAGIALRHFWQKRRSATRS